MTENSKVGSKVLLKVVMREERKVELTDGLKAGSMAVLMVGSLVVLMVAWMAAVMVRSLVAATADVKVG